MKRFSLIMPDVLYDEFYKLFPDHGQRTTILRRCVYRLCQEARTAGEDSLLKIAGRIAAQAHSELKE